MDFIRTIALLVALNIACTCAASDEDVASSVGLEQECVLAEMCIEESDCVGSCSIEAQPCLPIENVQCDCPTLSPSCCSPCPLIFYVGVDGGWAKGLNRSRGEFGSGANFNGTPTDIRAKSGYMVGANIGCRFNALLRSDVSYTYLKNDYTWTQVFPTGFPTSIKASLRAHLVLFNGYLHLNRLFCLFPYIDPYIGGGIGVASNQLHNTREISSISGLQIATIDSATSTHFGARVGLGVMKCLWRKIVLDLAFYENYIGEIRTGASRTLAAGPQAIGRHRIKNNWVSTVSLGAKYLF